MARRMFSPQIVGSDAFLDMPTSSRELYFQLGMFADDDGFINPKKIIRMIGASEDDLKILLAKRFVIDFVSGVIVIKHWLIHNLIRADLYQETLYKNEKRLLGLNENGAYTELREGIAPLKTIEAPKWLKIRRGELRTANVPQTALRIGKVRIGNTPASQGLTDKTKNMRTYDESKHSDSDLPEVDMETGLVPLKEKPTNYLKIYDELCQWAENQTGLKFTNRKKQYKALKEMRELGLSPEEVKQKWVDTQSDKFWKDKQFDFMTIRSLIKMK